MRQLTIGPHTIDDASDCYVIAEIGHNHQGSLEKCKNLFRMAKECGAHAVKLQKRDNKVLFTKAMYDSPYDHENSYGATYGEHRDFLEFGVDEYKALIDYAREIGITFFATAFDMPSADFLRELNMPAYKLASADLTNTPLLRKVAEFGKPMIVSTGGGSLEDVRRAYETIMPINKQLCILQCTAAYPVEPEDMNLRVIETFRREFPDVVIGLSDHQNGIAMSTVGYVLGARLIEKHFTWSHAAKGTDHAFSLEPIGMRKLVRDLQRARVALGDGIKQPLPVEAKPLAKMGKKLVASRAIPAGRVLTVDDVAVKSPNDGLPPYQIDKVLGMVATRDLAAEEALSFEILQSR